MGGITLRESPHIACRPTTGRKDSAVAGHGGPAAIPKDVVTEGDMNGFSWNSLIQALVLVRIGQELGTDSRLARAIHDVMHALVSVWQ